MFKKTAFWTIFILISVINIFFIFRYFPKVMSFVNLDIKMSRKQALKKAANLSQKYRLGPQNYDEAAIFDEDTYTQIYVELEGGGKSVFNEMLKGNLYKPYRWEVRHFKEKETNEASFWFTPAGEPYGFSEKLPESLFLKNVSPDSARIIAENFATDIWKINLNDFELAETKTNEVLSGRIDHSFIYERPKEKINEARYRLQITVSGNKVTELKHFMKIPEAFGRRYREMRSANNTIATASLISMAILYGLGGILFGIFFLMRKKWLLWKQAVLWGFIVAFLGFIARFNNLPLQWIWYNTAISKNAFLMEQLIRSLLAFISDFLLLSLTFMTAESLTRIAFPKHIQFWKIWNKEVAASKRVFGNTVAGYLVTTFSLTYIIIFYFFTTKNLNWWNPASLSTDPNALATYFPWLSAIANALHAGFWEESLFRAIPLAGAVLIGKKLKKQNLFLVIGLIIQALIFGAAHANYAAQPAYARVAELFVPSLLFAFLYLRFGLLTGILFHFSFDAVLMSLPIWITSAPGIWFGRIAFLILFFIPIFIVLWNRLKNKKWIPVKEKYLNKAWKPTLEKAGEETETQKIELKDFNPKLTKIFVIVAVFGIISWLLFTNFRNYTLPLKINRKEAISLAKKELQNQGIEFDENWKILATIQNSDNSDGFVWQTAGKDIYRQFSGKYVNPPMWKIRFAKFSGDVALRAEEYNVYVFDNGKTYYVWNKLPEASEGASLNETDAEKIALNEIRQRYKINPQILKKINASSRKRPKRIDWTFVYEDTLNYHLPEGKLYYKVAIAGEKVSNFTRFIYVPENWTREQYNRTKPAMILQELFKTIILLIYFVAGALGIVAWTKKKFSTLIFIKFFLIIIILQALIYINRWSLIIADFSTSEPLQNQIFSAVFGFAVKALFLSFSLALIVGFIHANIDKKQTTKHFLPAFSWAFISIGVYSLLKNFSPDLFPIRPSYSQFGEYFPVLGTILNTLYEFIKETVLFLFLFYAIDKITLKWNRKKSFALLTTLFLGIIFSGKIFLVTFTLQNIVLWLIAGILFGFLFIVSYLSLFRFSLSSVPIVAAVFLAFQSIVQIVYNAFPASVVANILAIIIMFLLTFYWTKLMNKNE